MAKSDTIKRDGKKKTPEVVPTEELQDGRNEPEELLPIRFDSPLKKRMIEALISSLGIVTPACRAVGISRWTHYRWLREDEDYRRTVEEMGDIALDFAENKLMTAMNQNDITAIIFYLKTKGKKRGYVERVEFAPHLKPSINMEKLTPDQRRELYDLIDQAEEDER